MTNQRINDVETITTFSGTDRLLINTDVANNVLEQIEKDDFVADIVSTDVNNAIEVGTDNKLTTSSDVTLQGNTFNGNSQLIQTNSSGQYPALDGSLITGIISTVSNLSSAIELRNIIKSCKLDGNGECDLLFRVLDSAEIVEDYTTPILNANGTPYVDLFAVTASKYYGSGYPYKATNAVNSLNAGWYTAQGMSTPITFDLFFSKPFKMENFKFYSQNNQMGNVTMQGSNDNGATFTDIKTGLNAGYYISNNWDISSTNYYTMYRLFIPTWIGSGAGVGLVNMQAVGKRLLQVEAGTDIIVQSSTSNPLIYVNPNSTTSTITSQNSLDFSSGYADGKYPLIQLSDGTVDVTSSYTESKKEPTNPANNDYWLNTSVIPNTLQKYEVSEWVEKQGIFIGNVNVASNLVSSVEQPIIKPNNGVGHTVIKTYANGTSGYRLWSDGFKEQWGSGATTITFLLHFSNTNYNVQANGATISNKATTGMTLSASNYWLALGY